MFHYKHFGYSFKGKFQIFQLQSVFLERNYEQMHHAFKQKIDGLNNVISILIKINRDYDFFSIVEQLYGTVVHFELPAGSRGACLICIIYDEG